jgi:hypothetical protein
MAEIEIHHEHAHSADPAGKSVGFLVGVIGVLLAVVTICAHRAHTAAVIHRTEANDAWAYYQAKKIRENTVGTAAELLNALAPTDAKGEKSEKTAKALEKFQGQRDKYVKDAEEIQEKAKDKDKETEHDEVLALRFDLGEGLLELGLVLSSLYFLGRQKFFPIIGSIAAIAGIATALSVFAIAG